MIQVVLLVQWYAEPSAVRRRELEAALAGNLPNRHVAAVVLLHGWADVGADPARALAFTNTTEPTLSPPPPHLRAAYQGTRTTRAPRCRCEADPAGRRSRPCGTALNGGRGGSHQPLLSWPYGRICQHGHSL